MSAFVALGTNMPWRGVSGVDLLVQAVAAMEAAGLTVLERSSVWRTAAWPSGSSQDDYLNAVIEVEPGESSPEALYNVLRGVETAFGRERREQWAPRTLDLDIVAMDGAEGAFGDLTLPHPRMHERAFVLAPLAEVAPDWVHPVLGRSVEALLADIPADQTRTKLGALAGSGG